jgi:hypothetical protein
MFASRLGFQAQPEGAPPPSGDPYWDNVVMLVTARNNVIQDASPLAKAITVQQSPGGVPSTTLTKHNPYSIYNANATRFNVAADAARDCNGDFTLEFWINRGANTAPNSFCSPMGVSSTAAGTGLFIFVCGSNQQGRARFEVTTSYTSYNASTVSMHDSQWHHVAATRSSGVMRFYYDGVQAAGTRTDNNIMRFGTYPFLIGGFLNNAGDNLWIGYIDDIRLTKGVARYTSSFTPPAAAFPIG